MKKFKSLLKNKWAANALSLSIAVIVFLIFSHLNVFGKAIGSFFGYFYPVILGAIIAYVLHPLVLWFQRKVFKSIKNKKVKYNLSILATLVAVILMFIFILWAVIPQLIESVTGILAHSDSYLSSIDDVAKQLSAWGFDVDNLTASIKEGFTSLASTLSQNLDTIMDTTISVGTEIMNWIIGFMVAVYVLAGWDSIRHLIARFFRAILPDDSYRNGSSFWHRCSNIFTKYIVCDLLDGLIVGISNYIFMMITGMPYTVLVSLIVGVTNLLPTVGPIFGAILGALILVLENPIYALIFLIFTIILQIIDGYILKPKMFGALLGVPGLLILIFIIVGGKMFGAVGILVAIPCSAIINFVYQEEIIVRLENWKKSRSKE